jgi:type II secretory pathway pseudopilin PulG
MIVVVAIVGLVVGVSFPAISAGLDSVRIVSATDSVAAFMNAAVNRSQRRQEAVQILVDLRGNRMTAISSSPGYTRELTMPDGIRLEAVISGPVVANLASGEPEQRILLLPGASIPGVGIQIMSTRGARRIVRLDPMTGYPRVESVKPS